MCIDPFLAGFVALGILFGVAMTFCCDVGRWQRLAREKKERKVNEKALRDVAGSKIVEREYSTQHSQIG